MNTVDVVLHVLHIHFRDKHGARVTMGWVTNLLVMLLHEASVYTYNSIGSTWTLR